MYCIVSTTLIVLLNWIKSKRKTKINGNRLENLKTATDLNIPDESVWINLVDIYIYIYIYIYNWTIMLGEAIRYWF